MFTRGYTGPFVGTYYLPVAAPHGVASLWLAKGGPKFMSRGHMGWLVRPFSLRFQQRSGPQG